MKSLLSWHPLHIDRYCCTYAEGATIKKTSPRKEILLRLGDTQKSAGGYEGYRNITIDGGTWDSNYECVEDKGGPGGFVGFRIGHATNVTVKNVTFLNNLKSHFLELAGVKNAEITGCTFRGYWKEFTGGGQECIQLDACMPRIFPGYLPYDGAGFLFAVKSLLSWHPLHIDRYCCTYAKFP